MGRTLYAAAIEEQACGAGAGGVPPHGMSDKGDERLISFRMSLGWCVVESTERDGGSARELWV